MNLQEFHDILRANPGLELRFVLPDGGLIPAHAHVTEVGRIDKLFMDCGGVIRREAACRLQTWVADDTQHRLKPSVLAGVLDRASGLLGDDRLPVEVEYEEDFISQYPVISARAEDGSLLFLLGTKHTDCLAKERCLPDAEGSSCCSAPGCCA